MAGCADAAAYGAGHTSVYRVAGRVSVSWTATEHAYAQHGQQLCRMVHRVGAVWVRAYYQRTLSQLAICAAGYDCRILLWVDLAEDRVHLCVCDCACAGGCAVAFPISDDLTGGAERRGLATWAALFSRTIILTFDYGEQRFHLGFQFGAR